MKELKIESTFRIYDYEELSESDRELIDQARLATLRSYVPYSHFSVGAAARLADGTVVSGNNQENASYPMGICAERTTLFYANSRYPEQAVETLAVAARNERGEYLSQPIPPCGGCRQVMMEVQNRYSKPLRVLLYGTDGIYEASNAALLLPLSFSSADME